MGPFPRKRGFPLSQGTLSSLLLPRLCSLFMVPPNRRAACHLSEKIFQKSLLVLYPDIFWTPSRSTRPHRPSFGLSFSLRTLPRWCRLAFLANLSGKRPPTTLPAAWPSTQPPPAPLSAFFFSPTRHNTKHAFSDGKACLHHVGPVRHLPIFPFQSTFSPHFLKMF